ncbi:MAG: hypothetical protein K0U78_15330 [Actinomycetia bacterium]|nr:hypothetical protein [Actinomycetes bacterium]
MVKIRNKIELETKPKFTRPVLLLHPTIPEPMHGVNPRTVMGQKWWDENRKKAYAENKFHCFACGVHKMKAKYHKWLEAHESYKIDYEKGEMRLREIVALCHCCHNFIHHGRMEILVHQRKMAYEKYQYIINHGNNILELIPQNIIPSPFQGNVAGWNEWHLLIDGNKYFGKSR